MNLFRFRFANDTNQKFHGCASFLVVLVGAFFAISITAQAVVPAPDGGYPNGNTAEGQNALLGLTTGGYNTAIGWFSLSGNSTGMFNTAIGAGALLANTADENTATGTGALLSNTTGFENTAVGTVALLNNTTGNDNTANGAFALESNTSGMNNTAVGGGALALNTTGGGNTAIGLSALVNNTTAGFNTAVGFEALVANITGNGNTAIGGRALTNSTGGGNTALGANAGSALTTGDNNIDIGVDVIGVAGEANTIRIGNTNITSTFIRGISGATASGGAAVFVTSTGLLGTLTSSARFKEEIKSMGNASEAILALRPVSFRYNKEIDPQGIPEFGLVAEEVEKVNPALVIRDPEGRPYTVRYEQVNAMLLNEFLKEHRKVEQMQKQIEALTAGLQKVSAQLELTKPASQTVLNTR